MTGFMVLSYVAECGIISEMTTSTKKPQWFGSSTVFQKHIAAVDGNIPAYLVKGKVLPPPG